MSSSICRLALAATVVLFVAATDLMAGDYHDLATLDCGDCHVMHVEDFTEADLVREDLGDGFEVPEGLLRDDINDLCLSCHDASARAADVLGTNSGHRPQDVRQAGSLNRLGRTGRPSTGHTLDSLDVAPGSSPPWSAEDENGPGMGLNCINCHAHHGRQGDLPAYRNLRSDAGNNQLGDGLITYNESPGARDPSRDVFVRQSLAYDESAVDFNEPDKRDSAVGRFCAGCHSLFHGAPGDPNIGGVPEGGTGDAGFLRHPSAGVNIGAAGGRGSSVALFASRGNRVKVMSEAGLWGTPGSDVTPTCITCHKGHGNNNPFGLIYRSGTGALSEDGDGGGDRLEHLCQQCHVQGLTSPLP